MQALSLEDVEIVVRLVAEAGDPTTELSMPDRKRLLMEGVARVIDADVWLWSTAVANPNSPGDVMTCCMIDGGWQNERQQALMYEAMTNPEMNAKCLASVAEGIAQCRRFTVRRTEFVTDEVWAKFSHIWDRTGLDHSMLTLYPFSPTTTSGVGFHRLKGKPNFSDRDVTLVHLIFNQVDWLHRHGTNEPAGEKTLQLGPRLRQVLILLLQGDSKQEIAAKLGISEHTVGDYTKALHKHFNVNSRPELQAYFYVSEFSRK